MRVKSVILNFTFTRVNLQSEVKEAAFYASRLQDR